MGLFDGIESADIFERGKYMTYGFRGILRITRTLAKDSQKSGVLFTVEFEVVANDTPGPKTVKLVSGREEVFDARTEHPVGSKVTWQQGMSDRTVAFPSIKGFCAVALVGVMPQAELDEFLVTKEFREFLDNCCVNEDDNDLIGQLVRVETDHKVTTRNHKDFTVVTWFETPQVAAAQ